MIATELQGTNQFGNEVKAKMHKRNGTTGPVVFNEPLYEWITVFIPALNNTFGSEMAQDFSFGGTPVGVHNGLDSVFWTATNISGNKFSFNSAEQFNTGAASIKANRPAVNNVMQMDNGSDIDLSNYVALTLYIFVLNNWASGDSYQLYGWDTATGTQVGDAVFLEDLFNESEFNEWHKIAIPLERMSLEEATVDAFRIECISTQNQSPVFYIDDFQIEETGNTQTFSLEANEGFLLEINKVIFSIVDGLDTRLADASTLNLSYNKFMALNELDTGLLIQNVKNGEIQFGGVFKTVGSFIKSGYELKNVISDGTNTCITLESDLGTPVVVDSRTNDSLNFALSDDLSGLETMSVLYKGRAREL